MISQTRVTEKDVVLCLNANQVSVSSFFFSFFFYDLAIGKRMTLNNRLVLSACRDGGLKRAKVKETFKEQQQKKYSNMVVRDDSSSNSD